ncbi:MAG: hypothetical protein ACI3W8_00315 [Oscillospiraceae bacterium]
MLQLFMSYNTFALLSMSENKLVSEIAGGFFNNTKGKRDNASAARPKAVQAYEIVFPGGVYVGKNTVRPANVRAFQRVRCGRPQKIAGNGEPFPAKYFTGAALSP